MNYWIYLINQHRVTAFIVALFFWLPVNGYASDFGVAKWGMTQSEVLNLETRPNLTPFNSDGYLIYELQMPGIYKSRIIYQFDNGTLTQGRFLFSPMNERDAQSALTNYQTIKVRLSDQYGPPNNDDVITREQNGMAMMPQSMANELAADRLILKSSWRSQTADIQQQLAWDGRQPHHQLHYRPLLGNSEMSEATERF